MCKKKEKKLIQKSLFSLKIMKQGFTSKTINTVEMV